MKPLPLLALVTLLAHQNEAEIFRNLYQDTSRLLTVPLKGDLGEPLILTPYLQQGKIKEAQQAALVRNSNFFNVTSYAGYFTVDAQFDSNLWFWYFPSADNLEKDPVVLWLEGGPGASSLNGLFYESGPFVVHQNGTVSLREYSWHNNHSVIYIDNPVGVGFSFTNDGGLAQNETKVGEDLYSALTQFFQLFPQLQNNPFFITGESYGGKYVPAIGHTILKKSPSAANKINLQGVLIGDGWTDPVNQMNYGPFIYNTGLVSEEVTKEIKPKIKDIVKLIKKGEWGTAYSQYNAILNIINVNAQVNLYNYLDNYNDPNKWQELVDSTEVRQALHVGATDFGDKGAGAALYNDIMQSVAPYVEELLENYRVLLYTGQADIICGYPMALDYINKLKFTGAKQYRTNERLGWYVGSDHAGYIRTGGNLVELMVRNAGHLVPRDQPKWAYDMLYRFTRNISFVDQV